MAVSDADMLDKVDTAISELLDRTVESYRIGSASYTFLDLDKLVAWKTRLETRIARASAGRDSVARITGSVA